MRLLAAALLACLFIPATLHAQIAAAITHALDQDPAPNKLHPAAIETFQLPSHGAQLNALMYIAAGASPHPTVILLHGFPGNEKNLDLAQTLRRAGYNVLFFNYRGSWGSPGTFSFTHCIEDVNSAIAWLRDPANATRLRVDPASLILIGHSMGGFLARYVGAQDPAIKAVALISAADVAVDTIESIPPAHRSHAVDPIATSLAAEGMAPLAGCTPKGLAEELVANADAWNIPALAPKLASRPIIVITSDDGLAPSNDAFVAALHQAAATHITTLHLATDHSYSDHRIALQTSILNWLATL
jgi:pimeloyl-ACP methyl ester carboxylesterase